MGAASGRWNESIASLQRDLEVARTNAERLRVENERLRSEARGKWTEIHVSTKLSSHPGFWATPEWDSDAAWRHWSSWCPVCKRPLEVYAWGRDTMDSPCEKCPEKPQAVVQEQFHEQLQHGPDLRKQFQFLSNIVKASMYLIYFLI